MDPFIFQDTNWRALLQYCLDNRSYVGCDLPLLSEHVTDDSGVCEEASEKGHLNESELNSSVRGISTSVEFGNLAQTRSHKDGQCLNQVTETLLNAGDAFQMNPHATTPKAVRQSLTESDEFCSSVQDDRSVKTKELERNYSTRSRVSDGLTDDHVDVKGKQRTDRDTDGQLRTERDTDGQLGSTCVKEALGCTSVSRSFTKDGFDVKDNCGSDELLDLRGTESERILSDVAMDFRSADGALVDNCGISMDKLDKRSSFESKSVGNVSVGARSVNGLIVDNDNTCTDKLHINGSERNKVVGNTGTIKGSKRDTSDVPRQKPTVKGNGGSERDNGFAGNICIQGHDEERRVDERTCRSMEKLCSQDGYEVEDSELNGNHNKDKLESCQSVYTPKFVRDISLPHEEDKEINCFDKNIRTPTLSEVGCDESSDEEIEEIVYKGDMASRKYF